MADPKHPAQPAQPAGQQIQIRVDESKMSTSYANTIRTTTTAEEVVLDFGLNLPATTQGGQQALIFSVGSRVIMNWPGAKRLATSLGQMIKSFEDQYGQIHLDRPAGRE